jgi:hypothetical protein
MKIYVVQIDMSETYNGTQWENTDLAFKTKEQAQADIEFKIAEYGIKAEGFRINEMELI